MKKLLWVQSKSGISFLVLIIVLFFLGCQRQIPRNLSEETEGGFSKKPSISKVSEKQKKLINDLPAGKNTVAVIYNSNNGGKYIFAGFGNDQTGLMLMEVLPPGKSEESLLTDSIQFLDLLFYLDPNVPSQVVEQLKTGRISTSVAPYRSGSRMNFDVVANLPPCAEWFEQETCPSCPLFWIYLDGATCGTNHPPFEGLKWAFDYYAAVDCYMNNNLNCSGAPIGEQQWCSPSARFYPYHSVGWSQRTASNYHETSAGSCLAYGRVYGCSKDTFFRALWRPAGSGGGWTEFASYWIEEGETVNVIMKSSTCHFEANKKFDFRFRADSNGQHLYGYTFFSSSIDDGGCNACH